MKRILLAGATLLALTAAQPTLAADAPVYKGPAPRAEALFNWSGLYIGVTAGAIWGNANWYVVAPPVVTPSVTGSGGLFGGTIGYNWQAPGSSFVFGLEGDISWTNVTFSPIPACGANCTTRLDWLGTFRGRAGLAFGSMLAYVTGGVAFGQETNSVTPGTVRDTRAGWTAGGGIEAMLGANWTVKGEYLYVEIKDALACTAAVCGVANFANLRAHILRGGLNYKF